MSCDVVSEMKPPLPDAAPGAPSPDSAEPKDHRPPRRRSLIGLLIVAVAAMFLFMVGAIWYFSVYKALPTASAVLIVEATGEFEGATITVEGPLLPAARQATVTAEPRSAYPFSLPAGTYEIRITERSGMPLVAGPLELSRYSSRVTLNLQRIKEQRTKAAENTRSNQK